MRSIYDVDSGTQAPSPIKWIENLLDCGLFDLSLKGLALRTRKLVVNRRVCEVLGYEVPKSFKRVRPRIPAERLDVFVQKSLNVQVWNCQIMPDHRYAIVKVGENDTVEQVRVILGEELARYDRTGTLTIKHQAKFASVTSENELASPCDTAGLTAYVVEDVDLSSKSPLSPPQPGELLSIQSLFKYLSGLQGMSLPSIGSDQERLRGAAAVELVCKKLGYQSCGDDGMHPDIPHQLLEVKLQTSPTIDLGMYSPDDDTALQGYGLGDYRPRKYDVRYCICLADAVGMDLMISKVVLATGKDFYERFPKFKGVNSKLQIKLPDNFFPSKSK